MFLSILWKESIQVSIREKNASRKHSRDECLKYQMHIVSQKIVADAIQNLHDETEQK